MTLSALLTLSFALVGNAFNVSQPNILYIVADDFGWADVDWHPGLGDARPSTPRLAALSAAGVRLESFYTQPICAATRSSILTGRYVQRLGFQHNNPPKAVGGVGAVPLSEKLLPQYFKDAGYATYHVGKWHGGMIKEPYLPHMRGFDTSFGYYEGAIDYYKHTVGGNILDLHEANGGGAATCQPKFNGTYDLEMFADRAKTIMTEHDKAKPFFMYLALHSVHDPDECPAAWYKKYPGVTDTDNRRTMCAMVSAMDDRVGDLVDHFHATLGSNAVLLFHSDNGGPTYPGAGTLNYPLRGGKLTLFEGGMRVNAFAWSPLIAKPGRTEMGLVHITDVIPTLAGRLGGANLAGGKPLDGFDVWDMISEGRPSPREEILHLFDPLGNAEYLDVSGCAATGQLGACQNSSAIRVGDWKLIVGMFATCASNPNSSALAERLCGWHRYIGKNSGSDGIGEAIDSESGFGPSGPPPLPSRASNWHRESLSPPVVLFNVSADPEERHDLAAQHPDIVKKLLMRLDNYRAQEWMDPQWPPYNTCDTPGHSCKKRRIAYAISAAKRGCCGPFVSDSDWELDQLVV